MNPADQNPIKKKRGRKPGSVSPTSLASKLLSIGVGETIYLDDQWMPNIASPIERQVRNVIVKNPTLTARNFYTERNTLVQTAPPIIRVVLGVTRRS